MKNFQAAAKCFEEAIRLFPQFTEARIDLGVVCLAGGRPDIAKKVLEDALKQNPKSLRAKAMLDEIAALPQKQQAQQPVKK